MVDAKGRDVEKYLRTALAEVERKQAVMEADLEPVREEGRKLRAMLRDYTAGTMGSGTVTDEQIQRWLYENASKADRKKTPEIAAAFNGDGRGFSNRMPRMAKQDLITGDPDGGYYVEKRQLR